MYTLRDINPLRRRSSVRVVTCLATGVLNKTGREQLIGVYLHVTRSQETRGIGDQLLGANWSNAESGMMYSWQNRHIIQNTAHEQPSDYAMAHYHTSLCESFSPGLCRLHRRYCLLDQNPHS